MLLCFPLGRVARRGPEDLSGNLVVQLGSAAEGLNRFVHFFGSRYDRASRVMLAAQARSDGPPISSR